MKDLCEFLEAAELQQYLTSFQDKLKVTTIDQIKYVDDEDLAGIGMSKPEIRRLRQFFVKERPQSALDKLRKMNPSRVLGKSDAANKEKPPIEISWPGAQPVTRVGASEVTDQHGASGSSILRKAKVGRSESARSSSNSGKRLTAIMIGRPENDLRHISHVGYDGVVFGDVSQYGNISDQLPVKANGRNSTMTSSCISLPYSSDNEFIMDKQYSKDDTAAQRSSMYSDDGDLSDFQMPDLSIELDFGASLMDEVMKALGMNSSSSSTINGGSSSSSTVSPLTAVDVSVPVASVEDENGSDTETETGSENDSDGSDTETENNGTCYDSSPKRRGVSTTNTQFPSHKDEGSSVRKVVTPTSPNDEVISSAQRSSTANIRAPRGIPGVDSGNSVGFGRPWSVQQSATNSSVLPKASNTDEADETNPLRRLRQNRMMFPS